MITQQQIKVIKDITQKLNPSMIGIFGSYARGKQQPNSDLDILIDFEHRVNLLDLVSLEDELSKQLGIKVDLVTLKSLNHLLKPYIAKDFIRLA